MTPGRPRSVTEPGPKTDLRLDAYADVDEVNSQLGVALAVGGLADEVTAVLTRVQNDLFDVGADFGTPVLEDPAFAPLRVMPAYVEHLESACDSYNERARGAALVHPAGRLARRGRAARRATVVRRAERSTWAALDEHAASMNPLTATYFNRLSDLLFILARVANLETNGGSGDVLWKPGGER